MPRTFTLILLCLILTPLTAHADRARRALEDLQDLVSESDADCARGLSRKLNALEDALEDGSNKRIKSRAREVKEFSSEQCPKKLNGKVRRALESLEGKGDDDEDDDDDDRPRSSKQQPPRKFDCGAGEDPACANATLDATAFRGLVQSLRSTQNELTKLDIVRNSVANQRLTAAQLGPVLDAFQNELLRLDAARAVVPTLVDRQHALVHASKWRNSLLAADFSKLLNSN